MKEYGRKSHVTSVIVRESLIALVISFLISIASGITLQSIRSNFIIFLPFIILLPALNDMVGDYSMIMVSRLSTLVFTKRLNFNWKRSKEIHNLFKTIISIAVISAIYIGILSSIVAYLKGFALNLSSVAKVIFVSLLTTLVMVSIVTIISAFSVVYIYKRKEDPNNLVMPLLTAIADLGTIVVFALVVNLVF